MRDASTYRPSDAAEAHFRKLQFWDRICLGLLGVMVITAIWNIYTLWSLYQGASPDLEDILNFRDGPAGRVSLIAATLAIVVFLYKEWRYGERSFGMVYFLAPWLFLALMPVMMDELLGATGDQRPSLSVSLCAPGSIVDGELTRRDSCNYTDIAVDDVRLAIANPAERDVDLAPPLEVDGVRAEWAITGRSEYTIYFLVRQESMDACEQRLGDGTVSVNNPSRAEEGVPFCHEQDDAAWLVAPLSTSYTSSPLLDISLEEDAP